MSDTHFTALDWRPSKKRASYPRQRAWGGQKQAPAAFIAAGKMHGLAKARRCDHCGRAAVREATVCRQHGGGTIASKRRPYVKTARTIALQAPETAVDV